MMFRLKEGNQSLPGSSAEIILLPSFGDFSHRPVPACEWAAGSRARVPATRKFPNMLTVSGKRDYFTRAYLKDRSELF
jgi:hypothetical protein